MAKLLAFIKWNFFFSLTIATRDAAPLTALYIELNFVKINRNEGESIPVFRQKKAHGEPVKSPSDIPREFKLKVQV